MTQYYVYELIDPRSGIPFYVGKGNGSRMYGHKKQAYQSKGSKINPHKSNKIKQIIESGNDITYKQYLCGDEESAFSLERKLIKQYGKRNDGTGILTNLTDGGEGYTGGHIPVKQYDLFGEYIQTHRSAKDAALTFNTEYSSQITSSCRGGRNGSVSAHGYLWSYVGELPTLRSKIKPVYQWTLKGTYIRKFISASAAARALNADPSNIPAAIKNKRHSGGFIWSYENKFPGIAESKNLKKIRHINTGIIYKSVTSASKTLGHNIGAICACCKGDREKIGNNYFEYI